MFSIIQKEGANQVIDLQSSEQPLQPLLGTHKSQMAIIDKYSMASHANTAHDPANKRISRANSAMQMSEQVVSEQIESG